MKPRRPLSEPYATHQAYAALRRARNCLLEEYRLDNFALLRWFQPASKRFHGAALQIREAPQPSDLLWENQDIASLSLSLCFCWVPHTGNLRVWKSLKVR